jgi:hypothetical protein
MCTAVSWWMDGWKKDIHLTSAMPQPPSVTTSVASFKFKRRAVATPSNAALAFAPSSCLHCCYASLTHAPFNILPPARPRSLLAVLSASLLLSRYGICYKLVTHRSGGNNPETQSRSSDGDRGQAIRALAELSRELISPVGKWQWRTTRSWRKLVKEPMARYLFFFPRVKLDFNVCELE